MTYQDIIDYLLSLLRDEDARTAFEQDPQGSLAAAGLQDVTADDIRDARLQLADTGAVSGSGSSGGSDPIHELHHTTRHFTAAPTAEVGATFIDQRTFIDDRDITVEDNDTTIDTTIINDSFNSDDDIVAIDNSVDNSIDVVTAIQDNSVENTVVDNSVSDDDVTIGDLDTGTDTGSDVVAPDPEPEPEPLPEPEPETEPEPDLGSELDPATTAV
ncbi:MAG: IniB N-terminal domain-containing protein [Pseudonocardia sp.]|uniref:IniB N-terminal domain-containing protein n=1 Tax=Pseudonocardia sp. TaxID=60912 RepID=UPI003D0C47F2